MADEETKADLLSDETPKDTPIEQPTADIESPPKDEPDKAPREDPKEELQSEPQENAIDIKPECNAEQKEKPDEASNDEANAAANDIAIEQQKTDTLILSSEPDLDKTVSTDAVEAQAARELSDESQQHHKAKRSIFANEGKWTMIWLVFTATYWTLVIWIPTLSSLSFLSPGLFAWCVGSIGLLSSFYTLYDGKYPSGATKDDPFTIKGIGRWTAFVLTGTVIIDFCILSLWGMLNGTSNADKIRGTCHLIHIFWCSLFFYGKFRKTNPEIATTAFFMEWFDMFMSCAVIFVLHNAEGDQGCFDKAICIVYFVYVVLELFGWIFPMMLIENWGTQKNAKIVSTHLFVLDLTTDVVVMLAVLIEGSYKINAFIMIDIIWKTFSVIRSFSYYLVYQLWLNKGIRTKMKKESYVD